MPAPSDDVYLDVLSTAVSALANDDLLGANELARQLAVELSPAPRRQPISPTVAAQVMRRDRFTCLYCGTRIVPPSVLRVASLVWPELLPYNVNWKTDATHPIYVSHAGTIDHVRPYSHGGSDAMSNLAAACWACNLQKSEFSLERLGWELRQPIASGWDGLVGYCEALWRVAQPSASPAEVRYHNTWLRAFAVGI
jgi:hypothetical protein